MRTSPVDLTAVELVSRLRAGDLSATELTRAYLERIAEREDVVHAWAHLDVDHAMAQAAAADLATQRGRLHGLPVGVKDIIDTADMPTELGSPLHRGRQPAEDAGIVDWLHRVGAVVLGKTVSTEFALFHPGPTANPRDPTRTPGGSSSGSAAAVAAGMVPLALATQTAGSIIRPASFCGVAGWKPTFGTFPTSGVLPVAPSLDTLGVIARDVGDLALFGGIDLPSPDAPPRRIGFAPTAQWEVLEPMTRLLLEGVVDQLGLPIVELPEIFDGLVDAQTTLMAYEAAAHLSGERRRGPVSDELARLLDAGLAVDPRRADAARTLAAKCRAMLPVALAAVGVDAILTPAVLGEAPLGLTKTGDPLCCRAWTLLGVPCVAVPGLSGPAGLPVGVQVVAPHGLDPVALAAAHQVEQALR